MWKDLKYQVSEAAVDVLKGLGGMFLYFFLAVAAMGLMVGVGVGLMFMLELGLTLFGATFCA